MCPACGYPVLHASGGNADGERVEDGTRLMMSIGAAIACLGGVAVLAGIPVTGTGVIVIGLLTLVGAWLASGSND
jgi:hypothetical protein